MILYYFCLLKECLIGFRRMITIRKYEERDVTEAMEIWNEVVRDGIANNIFFIININCLGCMIGLRPQ